jgi:hypothetical protein
LFYFKILEYLYSLKSRFFGQFRYRTKLIKINPILLWSEIDQPLKFPMSFSISLWSEIVWNFVMSICKEEPKFRVILYLLLVYDCIYIFWTLKLTLFYTDVIICPIGLCLYCRKETMRIITAFTNSASPKTISTSGATIWNGVNCLCTALRWDINYTEYMNQ